jgi:hypothetical protein
MGEEERMGTRGIGAVGVIVIGCVTAACGGGGSSGSSTSSGSGGASSSSSGAPDPATSCQDACSVIGVSDVKTITGDDVTATDEGRGGACLFANSKKIDVASLTLLCGNHMLSGYDYLKAVYEKAPYKNAVEVPGLGAAAIRGTLDPFATTTSADALVEVVLSVYPDDQHYIMVAATGPASDKAHLDDVTEALARKAMTQLH